MTLRESKFPYIKHMQILQRTLNCADRGHSHTCINQIFLLPRHNFILILFRSRKALFSVELIVGEEIQTPYLNYFKKLCTQFWKRQWDLQAESQGHLPNYIPFSKTRTCRFSDLGARCLQGIKY